MKDSALALCETSRRSVFQTFIFSHRVLLRYKNVTYVFTDRKIRSLREEIAYVYSYLMLRDFHQNIPISRGTYVKM